MLSLIEIDVLSDANMMLINSNDMNDKQGICTSLLITKPCRDPLN